MKKRRLPLLSLFLLPLASCGSAERYPLAHRMIFETDPDVELRIYVWLTPTGEWLCGAYCDEGWVKYPQLDENIPSGVLWDYIVYEEPISLPAMGEMLERSGRDSATIQVRVLPHDGMPKENEWFIPDSHYFPYILDQLGLKEKKV